MNCIIIDDEATARMIISQLCSNVEKLNVIEEFPNAIQAIKFLNQNKVDLIFLDIQLSKGSGFDIAKKIPSTCKIVFVTAFAEHALNAIKHQAFDYLLKPIDPKELLQSIEKCAMLEPQQKEQFLTIKSKGITIPVLQDSILYLKAKGPYSEIYFHDGNVYTTSQTLKDIQEKLNAQFIRTHKSYLINSKFIEGYNQKNVFLKNNLCFNISRLGLQQLQQFYGS